MAESGRAEQIRGRRRSKTPENEDRLSALPDSLIHHILSFSPSTKQAIRTGVLSKRWKNQWTCVSDLIFDFSGMSSDYSSENILRTTSAISRILDRILFLHDCPKIQKFHFISDRLYDCTQDPKFEETIRSVIGKQVEELVLKLSLQLKLRFPESFYFQPSFVKLQLSGCSIMPAEMVNWGSLKDLSIENCIWACKIIKRIVSGSPMLQSLELKNRCSCFCRGRFVIASKSLKRLVVNGIGSRCGVDIWCPNLVEFYGDDSHFSWCDKVLEKFLSDSPLLEVLELNRFDFRNLQIASTTLKRFVFSKVTITNEIQISCPHLKELDLTGCIRKIRLTNLPSSVCASLDLECKHDGLLAKQILEELQHLNELKLGSFFIESLSALENYGLSHPLLNCKSLTLEATHFGPIYAQIPGISYALRSSPMLEILTVKLQSREFQSLAGLKNDPEEKYWSSNGTHFSNLVPCLKTVEITSFSQREYKRKTVLDFVEFLLKNASALEKMVIVFEDCGTDFMVEVSRKLLSFPRCSNAKIDFICSK